jgi:hypothetical protein
MFAVKQPIKKSEKWYDSTNNSNRKGTNQWENKSRYTVQKMAGRIQHHQRPKILKKWSYKAC